MNPLALKLRNVRTFDELDLGLPSGVSVIAGANGNGKSTVLDAIDVALFAGRGELPALLTLGEEDLTLELQFEHAGEMYRVRRGYSARGRGKTTLDLEHATVPAEADLGYGWEPLTRETADATQQHLEQLLGLSRATFRASSFLAQSDGAAFSEASPRDRKAILAEILGLSIYDDLLTAARHELRQVEDEVLVLRGRIATLEEETAGGEQIQQQLATAKADLADQLERQQVAEKLLEEAQRQHAENAAAAERLRAAEAAVAGAKEAQERARAAYAAAVQAGIDREARQTELDQQASVAARLGEFEGRLKTVDEARQLVARKVQLLSQAEQRDLARERLARQAVGLRDHAALQTAKADQLDAGIGEAGLCDRCGQTLGAEAAAVAAASFRAEATQAVANAGEIEANLQTEQAAIAGLRDQAAAIAVPDTVEDRGQLETLIKAARSAVERRATLAEQVRQLAELAELEERRALDLAAARDRVVDAEALAAGAREEVAAQHDLEEALAAARRAVHAARAGVEETRATVVRLQVAEERVVTAAAELVAATAQVDQRQRHIDVLKLAERAFGRDGIPALIVENAAIPQLELEANRILGELGGATADCRIELRTQRLLKTTESLRETLDIVIVTAAGERAYETFSGGERTRLNLALRIALARLLAHRRGADSRLLAIDEPEFLDESGVSALADVLRGLSGDFDRILLVSHHPTLATSFDQVVYIVKDGERSRLQTEAVAVLA